MGPDFAPSGGPVIGGPCGGPVIGGPCSGPVIGEACGDLETEEVTEFIFSVVDLLSLVGDEEEFSP